MVAKSGVIGLALSLGLVFPAEAGAGVPERLADSFTPEVASTGRAF